VERNKIMKSYCVYIMTNRTGTLYVGMTGDLPGRLFQHRSEELDGFTARYNIDRLIYYEAYNDVREAIEREKQIKRWRRAKKLRLIATRNPDWRDLSHEVNWWS
jgi:putative endonuclease